MSTLIEDAQEFLKLSVEADSENRALGLEDLKFVSGQQWPTEMINSRQLESRPCLTINKLDGYCRQISNQQRQQRPRIKVHPVSSTADKKIADVITGLCRHIEVNSNADTAYDTAFDLAVKIGWGYWRLYTDYVREDSFDQDIFIGTIDNPFTCYPDPNSVLLDGSDSTRFLIADVMRKEQFKKLYPGADDGGNFTDRGSGDESGEWVTKEDIRVAEYFHIHNVKAKLLHLNNGETVWEDRLPDPGLMDQMGIEVTGDRMSLKKTVKWCKLTGLEVIEEKEIPGRWIPVIPCYGNVVLLDGKRKKSGVVRFGKDPQRMVNYWETAATEAIALAPKAKWLLPEGADEGHENEWNMANISAMPVLRFKTTDIDGNPLPPGYPMRLQPEPPPQGIIQAMQIATSDMREVIGITDPAMRIQGNVSGKALNAEKQQSDNATFHYYDNLTLSIKHTARIILGWVPHYYDTERVMRIIGDDGQPDLITINERQTTAEGEVVKNNVKVGEYDVVMDTGPGYNSKRMEAVEAMGPLMQEPEIFKVMGDLYFRNSDFPGAETIADRLASINPLAQIDEKSEIPPQAQMMIKQLQEQVKQAQQQLQQAGLILKNRMDVEQMKDKGQTQREHMKLVAGAHKTETEAQLKREDVMSETQTKAHDAALDYKKAMDVEELRGHIALLLAKIDESMADKAATNTARRAE